MSEQAFTLETLTRILHEAAGPGEGSGDDILDTGFEELGYDSLALLETVAFFERDYGVLLDDDATLAARTPRALLELVNTADRRNGATSAEPGSPTP